MAYQHIGALDTSQLQRWSIRSRSFALAAAATFSFCALLLGQVEATRGDSFGQLVVAQSILKNHTVELDQYRTFFQKEGGQYDIDVQWRGGHLYHYFPIGVPLLSLPAVALANLAGIDMRDYDSAMQRVLSATCGAAIIVILAMIGMIYFKPTSAACLAIGGFFGTAMGPTVGMALSSIGYEILLLGIAALLLLRHANGRPAPGFAWLLGLVLFLAYICRPTATAAIVPIFAYLLLRDRRSMAICAATGALLLAVFMYWSSREYGTLLPPYYSAGRLGLAHAGEALSGAFLSPSRNILIFNPFLPLVGFLIWRARVLPWKSWGIPLVFLVSGMGLFAAGITSPEWSGIWSYGPRLHCTMTFCFLVCSLCLLGELAAAKIAGRGYLASFSAALAVGLLVNLPGLYNPYTWYWNSFPNMHQHIEETVFDWRFPQFSASRSTLIQKYQVQSAEFGLPADVFVPLRGNLVLVGLDPQQRTDTFVWVGADKSATLALRAFGLGIRSVTVTVNGRPVAAVPTGGGLKSASIVIPPEMLNAAPAENDVSFLAQSGPDAPGVLFLGYSLRSNGG